MVEGVKVYDWESVMVSVLLVKESEGDRALLYFSREVPLDVEETGGKWEHEKKKRKSSSTTKKKVNKVVSNTTVKPLEDEKSTKGEPFVESEQFAECEKSTKGEPSVESEQFVECEKSTKGEPSVESEQFVECEKSTKGEPSVVSEQFVECEKSTKGEPSVESEKSIKGKKSTKGKKSVRGKKSGESEYSDAGMNEEEEKSGSDFDLEEALWAENDVDFKEELALLMKKKELALSSLKEFALFTDPCYQVNWHHDLLCQYLDDFVAKKKPRLIISMPPRHGKSELASRKLPAYIFGVNPKARIIASSYSADLASRMNRDVQRILDSDGFGELCPTVSLSGKYARVKSTQTAQRTSDFFEIVNHGGFYRSAGVGGGITGMGADYIILDDLIKNKEEAKSPVMRDKVFDWYSSTLLTRKEGHGCILIIMTRWDEDDLVGRLLALGESNPYADQWEVLNLPALYDPQMAHPLDPRQEGEPLWGEKFSQEELIGMKANLGSADFSALYQGNPKPRDGVIFRREWMNKRYRQLPHGVELIQSWDLAFKSSEGSAKCAGIVLGKKGSELFLVDCLNQKMSFTESMSAIRNLSSKYPEARAKVIEDKANGSAMIDYLKKDLAGLIPFTPRGSKEDRALSIAPYFEAGNIYFPENAPWLLDLVEDFVGFPAGKYKDTVDAVVQGVLYLMDKPKLSLVANQTMKKGKYWG